ncbi:MAG: transposase, partial [Acidobacteria bacterium]|nr:transposase [Acidobacteriota bacterium]
MLAWRDRESSKNCSWAWKVVGLLSRLVSLVRAAFPKATINLRLDGGFACPRLLDYLDRVPRLEYVCGLAKNAVLERQAQPLLAQARQREKQGHQPRLYG